jgi:hypothetical protein
MTKAIVIYYDGNEIRATLREVPEHIGPNSAQPHVWGLKSDDVIQAVVACSLHQSERLLAKPSNWHEMIDVYVDEMLAINCGEEQDL